MTYTVQPHQLGNVTYTLSIRADLADAQIYTDISAELRIDPDAEPNEIADPAALEAAADAKFQDLVNYINSSEFFVASGSKETPVQHTVTPDEV